MAIARPLRILMPLIRKELSGGDAAGLEHYRQAGKMLLEAREQVAAYKWGAWLSQNFELSSKTAWRYMTLAEGGHPIELKQVVRLHRELAADLLNFGYRALATRLHPDHAGSKDAMSRLNRVRTELKSIAKRKRFI